MGREGHKDMTLGVIGGMSTYSAWDPWQLRILWN